MKQSGRPPRARRVKPGARQRDSYGTCARRGAKFNHDHWETGKPLKVEPAAVVWEVLRRHPRAEKLLAKEGLTFFHHNWRISFRLVVTCRGQSDPM